MRIDRVLAAVANQPWALAPDKFDAMVLILHRAAMGQKLTAEQIEQRLEAAKIHPNTDRAIANKPGAIGVIPFRGIVANRASMIEDVSPGTGTSCEAITRNFRAAMANDDIKAIVFDADSPGGSVYGVEELGAEIYKARGTKPIVCQVNAVCASACYWAMSACDEIVVTPSGQVGAIGVIGVHMDESANLAKEGYKPTIISAGKYKADGNPYEPLTNEAQQRLQTDCEAYYSLFIDSVARNRGVTSSAVRDGYGEGRSMIASAAIAAGMADRVGTMAETLARWGVNVGTASKQRAAQSTPALNVRRLGIDLI